MEAEVINQLNNTLNDLEKRSEDIRVYMDYQGKKDQYFPAGQREGRPRVHSARNMINAIFYVQVTGCQTIDRR